MLFSDDFCRFCNKNIEECQSITSSSFKDDIKLDCLGRHYYPCANKECNQYHPALKGIKNLFCSSECLDKFEDKEKRKIDPKKTPHFLKEKDTTPKLNHKSLEKCFICGSDDIHIKKLTRDFQQDATVKITKKNICRQCLIENPEALVRKDKFNVGDWVEVKEHNKTLVGKVIRQELDSVLVSSPKIIVADNRTEFISEKAIWIKSRYLKLIEKPKNFI